MHARVATSAPNGGPPIVFVHGLGVSSRYMVPTALRVAAELHVHAVDLPGFGLSSKPDRPLDVSQLAEALAAWLIERRLERVVVVANSFGCQVAAELAVSQPPFVEALILLAPTVDPEARSTARHAARWLLTLPWEKPSLAAVIARDYRDAGLARVRRTVRFALDDRVEAKLSKIDAPVLVVRGDRDRVVPQRWAEQAAGLAPRGRITVIAGGGHCLNFGAPAEVASLIKEVARASGPSRPVARTSPEARAPGRSGASPLAPDRAPPLSAGRLGRGDLARPERRWE